MAGYSGKSLVNKLGIKSGYRYTLVNAPDGFLDELEDLPADATLLAARTSKLDCAIFFTPDLKTLKGSFSKLSKQLLPAGMLWVAWPKKSAKTATDLNENIVRDVGLKNGLVDVKVCAINEVWSGLKFVRRLKDR